MNRNGESGETPKRKSRIFGKDGYWYYTTREGFDIGPFDSQQEAEKGVSHFIDFVLHASPEQLDSLTCYNNAA